MTTPTHIGRYEVLAPLGRGGMGAVYLARDDRLDREVAIKVLPEELARDPERLAGFEREAKILASLNHPHIAIVYGFESTPDGARFLVLERIQGETLEQRLRRGRPALAESLGVGLQIADALRAAHERGIVHRDLKPGNVMVDACGRVKVLDFGLAKRLPERGALAMTELRVPPATAQVGEDHAPARSTMASMLGTPGYASPEQILGDEVGPSADLFAFGCLLFECLAGTGAFRGETGAGRIEATLREDPDWNALPADIPAPLRDLLARCLEKAPDARPDGMEEAAAVLASVAGISSGPGFTAVAAGPSNLPAPLTRFIGRERELAWCGRLLGASRLLSITGVAGCGKTRLALELAARRAGSFREGTSFVDLTPLRDGTRVIEAIAAAVGAQSSQERSAHEAVIEVLRHGTRLLLLDNCEHLAGDVAGLAQGLLESGPGLRILVTSREPLRIPGEQIFMLEPLTLPRSGPASPLESESVQFFLDRARLARPEIEGTRENLPLVVEICERLEGIPLALELAAARLRVLSLDQIRSRLEDRFRLLAAPGRAAQPHHRTLHAAIEWSYEQMVEVERVFFRRLAVFAGGWTLQAAAAVAEENRDEFAAIDLLTRLWDKSLVVVDRAVRGEPRYRYLETIRAFALEKLTEEGDEPATRDRHLEFAVSLAEETYPLLGGSDQPGALARLGPDRHNFLEALAWADRTGRDAQGLRLASSLWNLWMMLGEYRVGRQTLSVALGRPGAQERSATRARALYGAGWLGSLQGDRADARSHMEQSLGIAREIGDVKGISRALAGLGVVALEEGDYARARSYGMQALEMNRSVANLKGVSAALNGLGNVAYRQGDVEAARAFMEEALALHRQREDHEGVAVALVNLGEICVRLGRVVDARRMLLECLQISRQIQAKHIQAVALANVANFATTTHEARSAARFIGAAEAIWDAIGYVLPQTDREDHEAGLSRLRELLGEESLERARREGASLALEEALAEGIAYLGGTETETVRR